MIGVALAAGAGALGVGFALRASIRIARLAPRDAALAERHLRSTDDTEVASAIRDTFADAAPAMIETLTTKSARAMNEGAAALDERLGELDRDLSEGRTVTSAAARVALLSAGLGAVLELLPDLSGPGIAFGVLAGAIGVAGAAACFELGRRSAAKALELRAVWDRLAGAAAGRLGILVAAVSAGPVQARQTSQTRRRRQIR